VTRADLSPGYQATQATHAGLKFARLYPDRLASWFDNSNCLVVLASPDEETLSLLATQLKDEGFVVERFHEPDIGNELTAIALAPADTLATRLSTLPLALRTRDPRSTRERRLHEQHKLREASA